MGLGDQNNGNYWQQQALAQEASLNALANQGNQHNLMAYENSIKAAERARIIAALQPLMARWRAEDDAQTAPRSHSGNDVADELREALEAL